jgi:hypothetical protein
MYILDLCCGSQSVKFLAERLGREYISLDINAVTDKKIPTIVEDILTWDYKKFFANHGPPYFVHFSPPCIAYSILPRRTKPDIEGSNLMVKRGLDIIHYSNTKYWSIENPQTGSLKHQKFMYDIPYTDLDYCSYGFPYRKRTRLWNNFEFKGKMCLRSGKCPAMEGKKHLYSIGNSKYKTNVRDFDKTKTRLGQRFAMPEKLFDHIAEFLEK